MEHWEHDLISRGESGIAPGVSVFSVAEHLIDLLNAQITEKLDTSFLITKINLSLSFF